MTHRPFRIILHRSGRTLEVSPEHSALEALAAAGIALPNGCRRGVCGACLTGVVSGTPEHRDCFLYPRDWALNDKFLPCVSRAKSDTLVLDL